MTRLAQAAGICLDHAEALVEDYPAIQAAVLAMMDCLVDELGDVAGIRVGRDYQYFAECMVVLEDAYYAGCYRNRIIDQLGTTLGYRMPLWKEMNIPRCMHCLGAEGVQPIKMESSLFVGQFPTCENCLWWLTEGERNGSMNAFMMEASRAYRTWAVNRMRLARYWEEVARNTEPYPF